MLARKRSRSKPNSDRCAACRVYNLTLPGRGGTGSYQLKLIVDAENHPWRVETANNSPALAIQRVELSSATGLIR